MRNNFNRTLQYYYFFGLLCLVGGLVGLVYFHWSSGLFNVDELAELHESTFLVEQLKEEKLAEKVSSLADDDQVRKANKLFEGLENRTRSVNKSIRSKQFEALELQFASVRGAFKNLIGLPEAKRLLKVFRAKFEQFNAYVRTNNWRTLGRMSNRILARANGLTRLDQERLNSFQRSVQQDLTVMRNITKSSVLSALDKEVIIRHIEKLKTELVMLSEYVKYLETLHKRIEVFADHFNQWISDVSPKISLKKINYAEKGKLFSRGLILLILGGFLLIGLGTFLYFKQVRINQNKMETVILQVVNEKLVQEGKISKIEGEAAFVQEFERVREYVQKRMSYGNIFQKTLPFAGILLDDNLKLIWANSLFYESWGIESYNISLESFSWDFLKQKTNLGESDPIIEALQEDIAGIYQIQVKADQESQTRPYEMYISPMENDGQKRIMVYFYPLSSMEETIYNQVRSVVGPVKKMLQGLIKDDGDSKYLNQLRNDFENAGVENLYELFSDYQVKVNHRENSLLKEIEDLENDLSDSIKVIQDISSYQHRKIQTLKESNKTLNSAKVEIANYVEYNVKNEDKILAAAKAMQKIMQYYEQVLGTSGRLFKKLEDNFEAVSSFSVVRSQYKELLDKISNSRLRLSQSIDQTVMFTRSGKYDNERFGQSIGRLKTDIKSIENVILEFEKKIVSFDVKMSKAQMILERDESDVSVDELANLMRVYKEQKSEMQYFFHNLKQSFSQNVIFEENLVGNFKQFNESLEQVIHLDTSIINLSQQHIELYAGRNMETFEEESRSDVSRSPEVSS